MRKGAIVALTFLDHVQEDDKPMKFTVWGRVVECTKDHIIVRHWDYCHPGSPRDENVNQSVILQSTVIRLVRLREP